MDLRERKLQIKLVTSDDGREHVQLNNLARDGDMKSLLTLTPGQARSLATALITAVNRAEVKSSPKMQLW